MNTLTACSIKNKTLGSIVGGAVGDALGYPVEFIYSHGEIERKYGEGGIRDYDLDYSWLHEVPIPTKAQVSDDTQMTLYTAEGLLYALENDKVVELMICNAYLHWYGLQVENGKKGCYQSELAGIDELNHRRAPGNTCISALRQLSTGKEPVNDSKGCGGIMRIAPIALYGASHDWSIQKTAQLAGAVAEITHNHQLSTLSAACAAAIIYLSALREGTITVDDFRDIVMESLATIESLYPTSTYLADLKEMVEKALAHYDDPRPDWQVIEESIGEGWVAEETLAIAIFSAIRHIDSFEECVVCAVNHGGDSDSTGAVAGNLIGAVVGYDAIPEKYLNTLQLREVIEAMATRLC